MKIIGHRGAKGLAPENTLASFKKALDYQVDEIECDARVTKDQVVILEHDDWCQDAAGNRYPVHEFTYEELRTYKPDITRLEDAIRLVNHAIPVQIEIKPGVPVEPLIALMKRLFSEGWSADDFPTSSADFKALLAIKQALPDITCIPVESWSGVRATLRARRLGSKRITIYHKVLWRGFVRPLTKRGYQLFAYTLNDAPRAHKLANFGLAGIFTDYPDMFNTTTSSGQGE